MTVIGQLVFSWSAAVALLAMVLWLATAVCSAIAWRRSGFRGAVLGLELLRLTIAAFAVLLLSQPEWISEFQPDEKPVVVVLVDQTGSMQTRDVLEDAPARSIEGSRPSALSGTGERLRTRAEAIEPMSDTEQLTALPSWADLDQQVEIVSESMAGDGTDLSGPLETLLSRYKGLRAVVIASDGDWNQGDPPALMAVRYRTRNIPIFAMPVGSPTRLPDLEVVSFDAPTVAVEGKTVRIPFTIDSSLAQDVMATVTMTPADGQPMQREVRLKAMERTSDAFLWKPDVTGEVRLRLDVPVQPGETIAENNQAVAAMVIREERLRVLIVEAVPRWEYRYLRNALSRDPGVEVSCLLFHPQLEQRGGGNRDYIEVFPEGKDQLAEYDVVFLGDVGLGGDQLTERQCDLLHGLVEQQASGLVFLPGFYGNQFSLLETKLAALYPVVMDSAQPSGWGSPVAAPLQLTDLGRRSLLTKLADTADENLAVWSSLPGFQWYAPVTRAKPGCDVLAVHGDSANQYGRIPLLVTRTFGAGKVLFLGTDGAWRWRKGVEDLYHYRFWGQVVRWMAYRRNMARGETMRLYYSPEQPQVRQVVTLSANVMETNGEPLAAGTVTAAITAPSGSSETVRLSPRGDGWGAFSGQFTPEQAGEYSLRLRCRETGAELETKLLVQGAALEQVGKPARPEVLEELARLSGGRLVAMGQTDQIQQSLATMPPPPAMIRRVALWSSPWAVGLMILLLAAFWIGRKSIGFV